MKRLTCERCGVRMRQIVTWPGGEWVQDWYSRIVGKGKRRRPVTTCVSEYDEDCCEDCGEEIIEACIAYEEAGGAPEPLEA